MNTINTAIPQGLAIAAQSAEFWRRVSPNLTVTDTLSSKMLERPEGAASKDRARLSKEGFTHIRQPGIVAPFDELNLAMRRIVDMGLPAAFIGVYDEIWSIIAQMHDVMDELFDGGCSLIPDFWASFAPAGDPGFTAHRKRPGAGPYADKSPRTLSVWIPVTDATPENGCIYVVPADQDRNYANKDGVRADARLQSITALPCSAGDVLIWTGETYHWSGRVSSDSTATPRMNLCWEFQDAAAKPVEGYVVDSYPYVPFEMRLGILGQQMLKHHAGLRTNATWRAVQQTLVNRYPMDLAS